MKNSLEYMPAGEMLKTLGHPARLKIIDGLSKGYECNVNKIVESLRLPQSTISQHLALLKNQGIIACRKEGVRTCYRVVDERAIQIMKILAKGQKGKK